MVHARINHGVVEVQDPIPEAWEGQIVKLVPLTPDDLTPDDDIPDLEEKLAAFHALGPAEYEPGEREAIAEALGELDRLGKEKLRRRTGGRK